MLDAFAGTDLSRVRALRSRLRALEDALAGLGGDEQQRAREADVLRYQVAEIAAAHLEDPDEETALRLEEDRLADAGAYREAALGAVELVDPATGEGGVLDQLGRAAGALSGREAFDPYRERLAAAAIDLSDVARSLRDEIEGWQDDPGRLGDVQERRRLLAELRRKYGQDLGAVIAYGRQAEARLAALEDAEGEAARLQAEREQRSAELAEAEAVVRFGAGPGRRGLRPPRRRAPGGSGHGGRPPGGAGGARRDRRAGGADARGQHRRAGPAVGPSRLGR